MRTLKIAALVVVGALFVFGAIVADAVRKPMDVALKCHIQVCKKGPGGTWQVIDELGPANMNFQASLLDMANGKQLNTDFKWVTKSKNGIEYSAKLMQPANISFNPVTGLLEGDVKFDCT